MLELVRRGDASIGVGYSRSGDPALDSRILFAERLATRVVLTTRAGAYHTHAARTLLDALVATADRQPR